jgi:protein O-GlcNAc transferase
LLMLKAGFGAPALAAFDTVLALDGDHLGAREARAMTLLALGRHEAAAEAFVDLQMRAPGLDYLPGYVFNLKLCCCEWLDYQAQSADITARVMRGEHVDVPLSYLAHAVDPAAQRACAEIYVADKCAGAIAPPIVRVSSGDSRLRIGYLSYDFRNHPVAQLIAGMIEVHDKSRFEIIGLSAAADDNSDLRRRLIGAFDRFEDVGALSDEALAQHIATLGIDVLVDLGGHTLGSRTRALVYRPAPVQISFLGFPGTLGTDFIDYIIADRHVIPEEERCHYAEQTIYLPDTYLPVGFAHQPAASPCKTDVGLPADAFVYCCFNAAFKFTPAVFALWMRVLDAVPTGVLWLRETSSAMKRHLAQAAVQEGVNPNRLIYAPRVPTVDDHWARFALADLFLDTTPYNAHTTASEALACGVPVLTQRGRTFASRVATSLLHAVELAQLSVDSAEDYERLAVELAQSPARLGCLKAHLRHVRHSAPLFDAPRYCRHLESAYMEAAARARRGETLRPLYVGAARSIIECAPQPSE